MSDFWKGKCIACAHSWHEMTCRAILPGGDPSNGPEYCPCADRIDFMESEIVRLRAEPPSDPERLDVSVEQLAVVGTARRFLAAHDRVVGSDPVTRDDTFAMKNAADDLRAVIALYDDARLNDTAPEPRSVRDFRALIETVESGEEPHGQ